MEVESEKPTWRRRVHTRIKNMHRRDTFIYVGAAVIYLGTIAMLLVLPLKLIPSIFNGSYDNNPNVKSNNNYLPSNCPLYTVIANGDNQPLSHGPLKLPYQRPVNGCRTFMSRAMEKLISNVTGRMVDKDLARIFENSYPNTLGIAIPDGLEANRADTTVSWYSLDDTNPLAYVVTGDIQASWLRDSAHQFVPYLPLLPYDTNLQTLFRGLINLQARYIAGKPYCNAFLPPPESGLNPSTLPGGIRVTPPMDSTVYQCKWEIDSLASFLRLSWGYWQVTNDARFINTNWLIAVRQIMAVIQAQSLPTIAANGSINNQGYTYQPTGSRAVPPSLVDTDNYRQINLF